MVGIVNVFKNSYLQKTRGAVSNFCTDFWHSNLYKSYLGRSAGWNSNIISILIMMYRYRKFTSEPLECINARLFHAYLQCTMYVRVFVIYMLRYIMYVRVLLSIRHDENAYDINIPTTRLSCTLFVRDPNAIAITSIE